jgi:hypothetical protein
MEDEIVGLLNAIGPLSSRCDAAVIVHPDVVDLKESDLFRSEMKGNYEKVDEE